MLVLLLLLCYVCNSIEKKGWQSRQKTSRVFLSHPFSSFSFRFTTRPLPSFYSFTHSAKIRETQPVKLKRYQHDMHKEEDLKCNSKPFTYPKKKEMIQQKVNWKIFQAFQRETITVILGCFILLNLSKIVVSILRMEFLNWIRLNLRVN